MKNSIFILLFMLLICNFTSAQADMYIEDNRTGVYTLVVTDAAGNLLTAKPVYDLPYTGEEESQASVYLGLSAFKPKALSWTDNEESVEMAQISEDIWLFYDLILLVDTARQEEAFPDGFSYRYQLYNRLCAVGNMGITALDFAETGRFYMSQREEGGYFLSISYYGGGPNYPFYLLNIFVSDDWKVEDEVILNVSTEQLYYEVRWSAESVKFWRK